MADAYYRYDPIATPAIIALVLFLLTTIVHLYQLYRTRAWYMTPMIVGGLSKFPPSQTDWQ